MQRRGQEMGSLRPAPVEYKRDDALQGPWRELPAAAHHAHIRHHQYREVFDDEVHAELTRGPGALDQGRKGAAHTPSRCAGSDITRGDRGPSNVATPSVSLNRKHRRRSRKTLLCVCGVLGLILTR